MFTSDGSHSLQLYFSWHNCSSPFYSCQPVLHVVIFEVFYDNIIPTKLQTPSGETRRYHVIIYSSYPNICIHSLEVAKLSILWISSRTLIIWSFSWSSWVLIRCSSRTPQIQRTIPLSAVVKRHIFSLDSGHVSQPYSKLFLIHVTRFISEILRLIMIGNSCLKPLHAAEMHALVASTQPPDSPMTSPSYWKVGTASNVFSARCTWVELKLSGGKLSPLHFLHLHMRSFFSVPLTSDHLWWVQRLQVWQSVEFTPTPLERILQGHLPLAVGFWGSPDEPSRLAFLTFIRRTSV